METLLLDLHSDRFFGDVGVLFIDIVGLLLRMLAITALWAWVNQQRSELAERPCLKPLVASSNEPRYYLSLI